MTGLIIGISLSWKYGKIYNIKCLFLSQMFTIIGIHVTHIHEFNKSYGHQTILFVGISGGTHMSTVDHDELNIFLSHPFTTSVARLYHVTTTEHVTDVNNRVCPPETMSYSALSFKSLFCSFVVDPIMIGMQIHLQKNIFFIGTSQWQT